MIELVEQLDDDTTEEPKFWHVTPFEGPFDRGLCGAPLQGSFGGHTWNGEGVDCVVCHDLAFGDAA